MEKYCSAPDGRQRLIKKIQDRFDYIESFSVLERKTTKFHRELATLYPLKTIITTNWDLFFEKHCKTVSFINDKDMAFWNGNKRSVLKIHGSISNYGTIIATNSDYQRAEESLHKGLLGSKLKSILAEKNIIFIGYSFSDTDFKEIYNFVKNSIGEFHKQSYVVTPFESEAKKFEKLNFIPIITDGSYFIEQIKQRAINENLLLSDEIYHDANYLLNILIIEHEKIHQTINIKNNPHIIFTMAYQDGMIDAIERALNFMGTGEYSNPSYLENTILMYEKIAKEEYKNNNYQGLSYFKGYIMALTFLCIPKKERPSITPPIYFLCGISEIESYKDLKNALKKYSKKFKNEYKYAMNLVKDFPEGATYHHPPYRF